MHAKGQKPAWRNLPIPDTGRRTPSPLASGSLGLKADCAELKAESADPQDNSPVLKDSSPVLEDSPSVPEDNPSVPEASWPEPEADSPAHKRMCAAGPKLARPPLRWSRNWPWYDKPRPR